MKYRRLGHAGIKLSEIGLGSWLTFGRGVKSCPGMHLAKRNMIVALQVLAERFPQLELLDVEAALPRRTVLRCPDALRVRVGDHS